MLQVQIQLSNPYLTEIKMHYGERMFYVSEFKVVAAESWTDPLVKLFLHLEEG